MWVPGQPAAQDHRLPNQGRRQSIIDSRIEKFEIQFAHQASRAHSEEALVSPVGKDRETSPSRCVVDGGYEADNVGDNLNGKKCHGQKDWEGVSSRDITRGGEVYTR